MHAYRRRAPWRPLIYPAVVAAALLLRWLGPLKTVAGLDAAVLIALLGGWRIFYVAVESLLRLRISGDLPVAIAALAAIAIGENLAAAEVILIMVLGEALEDFAVGRTHDAIQRLASVMPRTARVVVGDEQREVPVEQVTAGSLVIVRPGERIPVDGEVVDGSSDVDESAFTGEPLPAARGAGAEVLTGTINVSGALTVRAESVGEDTTLSRIIQLMQQVEEQRAPAERRADRYATYFVPLVLAVAAAVLLLTRSATSAIAVLVVACPCALVLAAPTAVVAGIGRLAREGVLVKRGAALEAAGQTTCVVFDKTGTLTTAEPLVGEIVTFDATEGEVLRLAASAESLSEHIVGRALRAEAGDRGLALAPPREFTPSPGLGVAALVEGRRVLVGRVELLAEAGLDVPAQAEHEGQRLRQAGQSLVFVAADGRIIGLVGLRDRVRSDAASALLALRDAGIGRIMMLTGDNENAAGAVAEQVGIDEVSAGLLPDEKIARIRELQAEGLRVVMVGDGVNDAPALAAADVGIGIGDIGTDIAAEAADVVLMTDDLTRLAHLVSLSREALRTIDQNIRWFAVAFNGAGVVAAAVGLLTPVLAAVVHQVGSLMVIGNSLRLLGSPRALAWRGRRLAARAATSMRHALGLPRLPTRDDLVAFMHRHRPASVRWGPVVLLAGYVLSGLYRVQPGETAVVQVFGRLLGEYGPGLHYRPPWPIGRARVVRTGMVRVVEMGFRTGGSKALAQPAVYEWNIQHRARGYRKVFEEATMLTGDANFLHVSLVVQYRISDPVRFLLRTRDAPALVRCLCEHAARCAVNATGIDDALTGGRPHIEQTILREAQQIAARYGCGIHIVRVGLQDVHPPLEVVDAFRAVASEAEQKQRKINQAEAYAIERVRLADGEARRKTEEASGYAQNRIQRASGEAQRFAMRQQAYRLGPQAERIRLHLQAVDESLAAPDKIILDSREVARRQLLFLGPEGLRLSLPEGASIVSQGSEATTTE